MKKLSFCKINCFHGFGVVVVMLIAARRDLVLGLERKAYDLGVQPATRAPTDRAAIINDDASIADFGRAWSRDVHARMINLIAVAMAKLVAITTFYYAPPPDTELAYAEKLLNWHNAENPGTTINSCRALNRIGAVAGVTERACNMVERFLICKRMSKAISLGLGTLAAAPNGAATVS